MRCNNDLHCSFVCVMSRECLGFQIGPGTHRFRQRLVSSFAGVHCLVFIMTLLGLVHVQASYNHCGLMQSAIFYDG